MNGVVDFRVPPQFGSSSGSSSTSDRGQPTWAIVTGLVRDPTKALSIFRQLIDFRSDGVLDGIVVSSWTGEYDRYPEVLAFVEAHDIALVECPQPLLKLNGHVLHQSRAVNLALDFVPDGAAVLKVRPDLAHLGAAEETRIRQRALKSPGNVPGFPPVFRRKPVVQGAFLTSPFYITDITVLADKSDLRKIFNFDYAFEFLGTRISPEQFFYANEFRRTHALFDLFLRVNDGIEHNSGETTVQKIEGAVRSRFYLDVLAAYHLIMASQFEVGFGIDDASVGNGHKIAMARQSFLDLMLRPDPATGIEFTSGTTIGIGSRTSVFETLVSGGFRRDAIGEAYLESVARIRESRSVLDDASELREGVATYLAAMGCIIHFHPNLPARLWNSRYRHHHGHDHPVVVGADAAPLEQEINMLRRRIDSLNQEVTALRAKLPSA